MKIYNLILENQHQNKEFDQDQVQYIEKYWDDLCQHYLKISDRHTSIFMLSMLNMLDLEGCQNVLEVGSGASYLLNTYFQIYNKEKQVTYYSLDISENLIKAANIRVQRFNENSNFDILNIEKEQFKQFKMENIYTNYEELIKKVEEEKTSDQKTLIFMQKNAENLEEFQDNQFDLIISNLCIMLTDDPFQMIQSIHRTLQHGSYLAISTMGRPENNPIFSLITKALNDKGVELPSTNLKQYNFGNRDQFLEFLQTNGFEIVFNLYQFSPYYILNNDQDFQDAIDMPPYGYALKDQNIELKLQIKQHLKFLISEFRQSKNPLGMEALIVIAKKI